jgi:murein DD-endopeptidase MepM/ murein hydrolase activator NlpD
MDRLTVIVVPDETSPVRRYRVSRRVVTRGPWVAAALLLMVAAGAVDYLRLRLAAVDVARLRAEAARQDEMLAALAVQLVTLEEEFDRLQEFERKVRIIADLPGAMVEAQAPEVAARGGQGGSAEGEADEVPQGSAAEALREGGSLPAEARHEGETLEGRLTETGERSRALAGRVSRQAERFTGLLAGLEGVRERLASTPSIWPSAGWVTSGFGPRISPFTGRRQLHAGLDIAADFGTEIVAPARGRVVFAGSKGALGKTLVLDHGHGLRTTYGHAAELFVKRGQHVERGTRIASVGSTGRSTGPHLHYAVEVNGKPVDPTNYILD